MAKNKLSPRMVLLARLFGIAGIVGAFIVYTRVDVGAYALAVVVTGIVALVAPEAVDALPWGPKKPKT